MQSMSQISVQNSSSIGLVVFEKMIPEHIKNNLQKSQIKIRVSLKPITWVGKA